MRVRYRSIASCLYLPSLLLRQDPVCLPGSFGFSNVNLVPITPVLTVLNPEVPHVGDKLDGVLPREVSYVLFDGTTSYNVGYEGLAFAIG